MKHLAIETPYFEPHEKPVRKGLYKVKFTGEGCTFWAVWNGKLWGTASYLITPHLSSHAEGDQALYWCGLTGEKP